MIRGTLILAGVALVIVGILLALFSGFTVDGRTLILSGGGLSLAVLADRYGRGTPA